MKSSYYRMISCELLTVLVFLLIKGSQGRDDPWFHVHCNQVFNPEYCNYSSVPRTVDEMDRCAPALLDIDARNYFLAATGRRTTYKDNKDAFDRIRLQPRTFIDLSNCDTRSNVLCRRVDFPIGLSPVARHKLVVPEGENATVRGLSGMRTVMILSALSTTRLEEVAEEAQSTGGILRLWMQTYFFHNRSITIDLVQRAESSGFEAIVVTLDSPVPAKFPCTTKIPPGVKFENADESSLLEFDASVTLEDISWLKTITNLPIIVKGILSGQDAVRAAIAGASAVIVSNHGGRQLDGVEATIDALPEVACALKRMIPPVEVYMDGGVRSGHDVFKAIARGARMVFVGRPQIWGLAYGGSDGVKAMMENLIDEFNETMQLTGVTNVFDINLDFLASSKTAPCDDHTGTYFHMKGMESTNSIADCIANIV